MKKRKILDEAIIKKLREEGLTYKEIVAHLNKLGIKVSVSAVRSRIIEIYGGKIEEVPKNKKTNKGVTRKDISEEKLIKLRQQGFSHREIAAHFNNQGIKVSAQTIKNRIKQVEEKESEPIFDKIGLQRIPDNKLKKLKEQGLSCKGILEYLTSRDIKVTLPSLKKRLRAIYENAGEKMPKASSKKKVLKKDSTMLIDQILKLRDSRNATNEQIAEIAKLYGVNPDGSRIKRTIIK